MRFKPGRRALVYRRTVRSRRERARSSAQAMKSEPIPRPRPTSFAEDNELVTKRDNPRHTLEGIITSTGGALGPDPALIIHVSPRRKLGGKVQRRERRIEVPMPEKSITRAMTTWDGKVVRLEVELMAKA